MKNIRVFLSEKFQFLEVKCSIYLNRHVFVMYVVLRLIPFALKIALFRVESDACAYFLHTIQYIFKV